MSNTIKSCINKLIKLKDKSPSELTRTYKKIKSLTEGKSGALVYIVKEKNKKYILKFYTDDDLSRPMRELISLCRLSGTSGFPKVYDIGYSLNPVQWSPDVKFKNDRGFYVVMSIMDGEPLSKVNIKMGKRQALNVSLSILHRLIQMRNLLGSNFEHYDLHPNNIFIDKNRCMGKIINTDHGSYSVECPAVYIIDYDLVKSKGLSCIPDSETHRIKKDGYFGFLSTVVPLATWKFILKWKDSVLDMLKKIYNVKNIRNTDIRNWIIISSVIFEINKIEDKIDICKDVENCINRNKKLFESLIV
jgi:serine/threonine protein kinase